MVVLLPQGRQDTTVTPYWKVMTKGTLTTATWITTLTLVPTCKEEMENQTHGLVPTSGDSCWRENA